MRMVVGVGLFWGMGRFVVEHQSLIAGYLGVAAILLLLHFGFFDLVMFGWRRLGVPVERIRVNPVRAISLAKF